MEPVRGDSAAEISNADENEFDWINTCYLCGLSCVRNLKNPNTSKSGRVSVVSKAENMREKTLLICKYRGDEWASEVRSRLEKVVDLRVVKAHYHQHCSSRFMRLQGKPLPKKCRFLLALGGRPTENILEKKMENFYKACEQLKVRVGDYSMEVAAEIHFKMKEINDDPKYLYKISSIVEILKKRCTAKPNPEEDPTSTKDIYFEPRIKRKISTKKVSIKDPSDKKEDSGDSANDSGDDFVYEPYVKRRYRDPSKKLRRESAQQPDRKTLVIKNLPESATEQDVRALSSDIKELRLDRVKYGEEKDMRYAVISFKDEFTAEQNYISLMGRQVKGTNVVVEYSNCRSVLSYMKIQLKPSTDPKKLVVTGFGREFNEIRPLKKMFPASTDISIPINPADNRPFGFAFVQFPDEESARVAHDTTQDYVFQERLLVVMYAKKSIQEMNKNAAEQQDEHITGLEMMNGLLNADENNENGRELEEIQNGEVEIEGAPEEKMTEDEELNGILSELGVEVLDDQRDNYIEVLL